MWSSSDLERIDVDDDEVEVAEDPVHGPLKRGGRIDEAERHARLLEQATMADERRLVAIIGADADVVVPVAHVERRKVPFFSISMVKRQVLLMSVKCTQTCARGSGGTCRRY